MLKSIKLFRNLPHLLPLLLVCSIAAGIVSADEARARWLKWTPDFVEAHTARVPAPVSDSFDYTLSIKCWAPEWRRERDAETYAVLRAVTRDLHRSSPVTPRDPDDVRRLEQVSRKLKRELTGRSYRMTKDCRWVAYCVKEGTLVSSLPRCLGYETAEELRRF